MPSTDSEPILGFGFADLLPGIRFDNPIAIRTPTGFPNTLFVAERLGRVYVIADLRAPEKTLFLDLADSSLVPYFLESGLLCIAFHPNFQANGQFFVYRSVFKPGEGNFNRLSRFNALPGNPFVADPKSERIILEERDFAPQSHNGGDIQFGPDGYLYLSLGDLSPPPEDWVVTRQPIDKGLFGTIIRIDVDKKSGSLLPRPTLTFHDEYRIPPDNPFIGFSNYQGYPVKPEEVRTEIFALGFRNPWRFSFDPLTGKLIVGDVGESTWEELNLVEKGGNYGWPYREAEETTLMGPVPPAFSSLKPLWKHPHGNGLYSGNAIIGGLVYQGNVLSSLKDDYLFGDFIRGNIWVIRREELFSPQKVEWIVGEPSISTFGIDPRDNEILVANLLSGKIKKLVYRDPAASTFPKLLSQTGAFSDLIRLQPTAGVVPYDVNVSFWSDYAAKQRWFYLTKKDDQISFSASNNWSFPTGATWIKHFELEQREGDPSSIKRLETRFLVKTEFSAYGVTYKWNAQGTDAELVPPSGLDETILVKQLDGTTRTQRWQYPSHSECKTCHNQQAGYTLGFNTVQLNLTNASLNQLEFLANSGYLKDLKQPTADLPRLAHANDETFSYDFRVRSYFEANCSQCHRPGAPITAFWDARFHTPMANRGLVNQLVIPNEPENSWLLFRVYDQFSFRMPPIGSTELNHQGIALLEDWISSFPQFPWGSKQLGQPSQAGYSSILNNDIGVETHAGKPFNGRWPGHYLYRSAATSVQLIAKLKAHRFSDPSTRAGILLQTLENSHYQSIFAGFNAREFISSISSEPTPDQTHDLVSPNQPLWLRVVKQPSGLQFWFKQNSDWKLARSSSAPFPESFHGGYAIMATNGLQQHYALFENSSFLSFTARLKSNSTQHFYPDPILVTCEFLQENHPISKVNYFANGQLIASVTESPYSLNWTPTAPGNFEITARAIHPEGFELNSNPIQVTVQPPRSGAWFHVENTVLKGDWVGAYGREAYLTPSFTKPPSQHSIRVLNPQTASIPLNPSDARALSLPDRSARSSTIWKSPKIEVEIDFSDANLHQLALYFADLENLGVSQKVVVTDRFNSSTLLQKEISNFSSGKYLVLHVRGSVRISIEGSPAAILSGFFLDPSVIPLPRVELDIIPPTARILQPIPLRSSVSGSSPFTISYLANDQSLGASRGGPPYELLWRPGHLGAYSIAAQIKDAYGQTALSQPRTLSVVLPPAKARFLGADTTTRGNWIGEYGKEGYVIIGNATNLPPSIGIEPSNHHFYNWYILPTNPSALQTASGNGRIGAAWAAPYWFTTDILLKDGLDHIVSFYIFDDPLLNRKIQLEVLDAATGELLDSRLLENFVNGTYYKWRLQGAVRFKFNARATNPMICAFFIEPCPSETFDLVLSRLSSGLTVQLPSRLPAHLLFHDDDHLIKRIGLNADGKLISESPLNGSDVEFPKLLAGERWLSATALDARGARVESNPVMVKGILPSTSLQFLGTDDSHQGNWKGLYGKEAFAIPGDATNVGAAFQYRFQPGMTWIWHSDPENQQSLVRRSKGRIASTWYALEPLNFYLDLLDGEFHKISLYLNDYDYGNRVVTIKVFNPDTGTLLDSRTASNLELGRYYSWEARGRLHFQLECPTVPVINAFFIDPAMRFGDWAASFFSDSELGNLAISGPLADPDSDTQDNQTEFARGTNPLVPSAFWSCSHDPEANAIFFTTEMALNVVGYKVILEKSENLVDWTSINNSSMEITERFSSSQKIVSCRVSTGHMSPPGFLRLRIIPD